MTMERLASVEVQLIMNYLTRIELTLFSRCSRRLFSDGDTDRAWSTQDLYCLTVPENRHEIESWLSEVSALTPALFMRHQRMRLTLDSQLLEPESTLLDRFFKLIPRLERVTFGKMAWWEVFRQQSQLRLTHLIDCEFYCDFEDTKLSHILAGLQKWTNLRILTLPHGAWNWEKADSGIGLQSLPCLTNLTFSDYQLQSPQKDEGSTISASIMRCERLSRLFVRSLKLSAIDFQSVFTSSNLSGRLTDLTISEWAWLDKSEVSLCVEALRTTWSSLTSLEHLSLIYIGDIALLITTLLTLGPHVRLLEIHSRDRTTAGTPSSHDLHQLLIRCPQLSIELTLWIHQKATKAAREAETRSLYLSLDESTKQRLKFIRR